MTDRYSLPPQPGDPVWAISREPAPPLWAIWCNECDLKPDNAGPLSHRLSTAPDEEGLSQRLGSGWRLVEGTGSSAPREAQQGAPAEQGRSETP